MARLHTVFGLAVAALVSACGSVPGPAGALQGGSGDATLTESATRGRFSGLQVLGIEPLPVRCPCFELKAEATNKKGLTHVVIHFERIGAGEETDLRIQSVQVDNGSMRDSERVHLARALAAVARKPAEDSKTIKAVARAILLEELE
ncbi:MAG: hypothetical protein FJZ00_11075 [Candidatus Sericytochromatia bacterium]|uniref:TonB C-terminal domain-containing protein n=1 Tax=Candidatus Tanganyikabacteria bacterium TaxID=2961651 RepID=A0A937X8R9_9BACT|nr:hypothetical protein [Candidatus Tanganyikabacteria bacterium]